MLAIWSLVPLPFLNPAWTSGISQFMSLKPGLEDFEHYFANMWVSAIVQWFEHSFALPFFGIWRRQWHPTPVLLPGKSHGWRSLEGCSPWGCWLSNFIGMKTDLFQSCDKWWVFEICWHIECSTFTLSSFRIWNSSTGMPALPLALFVVMLLKAHLTSHSRMSGSRWVITPSWLSGSWRFFV